MGGLFFFALLTDSKFGLFIFKNILALIGGRDQKALKMVDQIRKRRI